MVNQQGSSERKTTVFTIGTSKKSAREFFQLLRQAGVRGVIDVRLSNESQLAGFSKKEDLRYFLKAILNASYHHIPELAPTREILVQYRKREIGWADYETRFVKLLAERRIESLLVAPEVDGACLLCTEAQADKCHRRLVAEYLRSRWGNVVVTHL